MSLNSGQASDGSALQKLRGRPYAEVAEAVIAPFVQGFMTGGELRLHIDRAYAAFGHPAVAPLSPG